MCNAIRLCTISADAAHLAFYEVEQVVISMALSGQGCCRFRPRSIEDTLDLLPAFDQFVRSRQR